MLRIALFDLDDTLYAAHSGLWTAIGARIERFMVERVGLAAETVTGLRREYLDRFGTTLNGLRHEHHINAADYLAFVHDVPLEPYIHPSPALDEMLRRLRLKKVIFTNSDAPHARRVLARLGIEQHFSTLIDITRLEYDSKPNPRAYERALALLGAQPDECVLVDDALRNLQPAHALGMLTVLVRAGAPAGDCPDGVDHVIETILELEHVVAGAKRAAGASRVRPATEAGARPRLGPAGRLT